MSAAQSFIVTTSVSGSTKTQLWNPELPLTLGHPLRWIAERTQDGVRIRNLGLKPGQLASGSLCEITNTQLEKGTEVRLPGNQNVSLRIRPALAQNPAFGGRQGDRLSVYACNGAWVLSSALFDDSYHAFARVGEQARARIFTMRKQGDNYVFDIHVDGVSLGSGGETAHVLTKGQTQVPAARIADAVLHHGTRSWRFGLSQTVTLAENRALETDAETAWFKRSLVYAAAGFSAIMIAAWVWPTPTPDTQEIIPPQFAKVILQKPQAQQKSAASEGNPTEAKSAAVPEKVNKAAVVQAFRAKALSNAVSGLLKGGMTSLLAQSDFVAGKSKDGRKIFDAKSAALASNGPATGVSSDTNKSVETLGGSGQGKGAGYGKGEKAGVKGQGAAFVSMDIGGAAVDEGLTKDEVGEVIHRHLSEVRYCYESAMVRTPDLEGKLMVGFTIGGNGTVKSTEVKSSTLPDPRLDDCILRRLTTWKFPLPRGGIDVSVAYPFIFKTLGR